MSLLPRPAAAESDAPAPRAAPGNDRDFWSPLLPIALPFRPWTFISSSLSSVLHQSWSFMLSPFNMADTSDYPPQDAQTPIPSVNLDGPLKRLKTLAEVQASEATIDVFIAEVHPKATKVACDAMRPLLPPDHKKINLAHLRRPCTYAQLPDHLQPILCPPSFFEAITPKSRRKKGGNKANFILLCATCLVEEQTLLAAIVDAFKEPEYVAPTRLHKIPVPLLPPTSVGQAERWSALYWPTSFKNNNPYGPSPSAVARAEWELLEAESLDADTCMRLARTIAADSEDFEMGQPVGVVIVERIPGSPARIVAVASDARYQGHATYQSQCSTCDPGNIAAHAVMRAIGMVAQKRRIIDKKSSPLLSTDPTAIVAQLSDPPMDHPLESAISQNSAEDVPVSCLASLPPLTAQSNIFLDVPVTDREKRYFDPPTLAPRGYLCLNLELYITHEPCIMCSMAVLHSRFGRVIFEKEMRTTGALMAERQDFVSVTKDVETKLPLQRSLPPTKSAKRRNSRKNSRLRAIQAEQMEHQARNPPLEYGLWWRAQLNWKFFCWQWRQDRVSQKPTAAVIPTSSSSSDEDTSRNSESRRPSLVNSSTSGLMIEVDHLADLVKSMTVSIIPDRVHI